MAESETSLPVGIDRISFLPKPILVAILSMLPTRCAIPTSLLSSRWRYLWTSVTNLDIVEADFRCRLPKMSLDMKRELFTQFVNRVLIQLNALCLQKFHLDIQNDQGNPVYLESWICAAFGRTVKELHLVLRLSEPFELPLSHFYCNRTPAVLKLSGRIHFNIAPSSSRFCPNLQTLHLTKVTFKIASGCSVSFPSLKELFLLCVNFVNEDSVNKLLSSCPVLDNLYIERCGTGNISLLYISIPSLISLKIVFRCVSDRRDGFWQQLQINTPALKYLYLSGRSSDVYLSSENLSSLIEAKLIYVFDQTQVRYIHNFFGFFVHLFKVKFLSISGEILKVAGSTSNIVQGFHNLSRLELDKSFCRDWSTVINLLNGTINLEHLILKGSCNGKHESWWTEPLCVPSCLLQRVTTISFVYTIGDCRGELELVRYFLKNAKVLQKLTVHISLAAAKFVLMRTISEMPRGSQECKVVFEELLEVERLSFAF